MQGVIAHELGHVAGGHAIRIYEGVSRATAITILSLVLGAAAIVLCMAYLVFVLVAWIAGKAIPPGFVSLIFAFAFLSSVNLTMIGVLGVYIARIHEEVRARPTYLVARNRVRGN